MDNKRVNETYNKTIDNVMTIVGNIFLIYIANNLLRWNIPHLESSFIAVLWIFNISFAATIVLNLLFIAVRNMWFRAFGELLLNIISFIAIYSFYRIYPLDFSGSNEQIARVIIFLAMIGVFIAIIVELVSLTIHVLKND